MRTSPTTKETNFSSKVLQNEQGGSSTNEEMPQPCQSHASLLLKDSSISHLRPYLVLPWLQLAWTSDLLAQYDMYSQRLRNQEVTSSKEVIIQITPSLLEQDNLE